jgi:hypothetical protein
MRELRTAGDTTAELTYLVHNGNYDVPIIQSQSPDVPTTEMFLQHRIDILLAHSTGPVVCMDVGSGASVSALRLAKQYREAIAQSRLALVTTNLAMKVSEFIDQIASEPQRKRIAALHTAQQDAIHELTTDFTPGQEYEITLPDGTALNLEEKVDIVHEHLSLTAWADDPLHQIPALGRLVSGQGIYMVREKDVLIRKMYAEADGIDPEVYDQAHQRLQQDFGQTLVQSVEQGEYADEQLRYMVFKGPQAPPISL